MTNQALLRSSLATAALAVGALVYLFDRPAGSTRFVPEAIQLGDVGAAYFGSLGPNLPSFLHIYAFILFTVAVLRPNTRRLLLVCGAWFFIDAVFEFQQYAAQCCGYSISELRLLFAAGGVFDLLDIVALALGTAAAFATAILTRGRTE